MRHARTLDAVEELAREAALSDARLAVDREEMRATVAEAAVERVLEELELGVAADERGARAERACRDRRACRPRARPEAAVACPFSSRGPASSTTRLPAASRYAVGPTRISPGRRGLLESRCQVDGLAGRERRLGVVDDDLAGLDPDARLELELVDRLDASRAPRARRAARRPRVPAGRRTRPARRRRRTSRRSRRAASTQCETVSKNCVHAAAHDLGVGAGDEPRRVDEVDEQHRCELALHA